MRPNVRPAAVWPTIFMVLVVGAFLVGIPALVMSIYSTVKVNDLDHKKAPAPSVMPVSANPQALAAISTKVDILAKAQAGLATEQELVGVQRRVSSLSDSLVGVASKTDISALSNSLSGLASKKDIAALQNQLSALMTDQTSVTAAVKPSTETCIDQVHMSASNIKTKWITKAESGGYVVADSSIAVGNDDNGGRIITTTNQQIKISRKTNGQTIYQAPQSVFYQGPCSGDASISYDSKENRFFGTSMLNKVQTILYLYIDAPLSIAGAYLVDRAEFGLQEGNVTGDFAVAEPFDACSPLTNPGAIAGKIALVQRGTCFFTDKALNAQLAGAIGVVVINVVDELEPMGGANAQITIPAILVNSSTGALLLANVASLHGTMTVDGYHRNSAEFITFASKNSHPTGPEDFFIYSPGYNATTAVPGFSDFPHHAFDDDALYISSFLFPEFTEFDEFLDFASPFVIALDKHALMSGTLVELWTAVAEHITYLYPIKVSGNRPVGQPTLLVGLGLENTSDYTEEDVALGLHPTGFVIYTATAAQLSPAAYYVPFPTPLLFNGTGGRQPPPAVPFYLESVPSLNREIGQGVVFGNSLWVTVHHSVAGIQTNAAWFELDITDLDGGITVVQWGNLAESADEDILYTDIHVDKDGNVLIPYAASGPNKYITLGHTGRLADDPPGTMRFPKQEVIKSTQVYYGRDSNNRNRYTDYMTIARDPVDQKTMTVFGQFADSAKDLFDRVGNRQQRGVTDEWLGAKWDFQMTEDNGVGCPLHPTYPDTGESAIEEANAGYLTTVPLMNPTGLNAGDEDSDFGLTALLM